VAYGSWSTLPLFWTRLLRTNPAGRKSCYTSKRNNKTFINFFFFIVVLVPRSNLLLYYYAESLQGFNHGTVHSARFANGHWRKWCLWVQIRRRQYNGFGETGFVDFPDFQNAESGAEQCECEHHQPKSSVRIIFIRCEKCGGKKNNT